MHKIAMGGGFVDFDADAGANNSAMLKKLTKMRRKRAKK